MKDVVLRSQRANPTQAFVIERERISIAVRATLGHPLCFISLRSINLRPDLLRQSSLKYVANATIVASCCHLTGRPHSHPCERYASSQPCVVAVLAHHRAQDLPFTLCTTTTNW